MPPTWQRSELALGGTHVSVLECCYAAAEPKPAILLLHGLVAEAETFRSLIEELPADRRIVALDLPGAGYSERNAAIDASFAGLAKLVKEAASALGLQHPVVLGHSHGAAIALRLAASDPGFASGLILLSPAHPFSQHEEKLVRFYLSPFGRVLAHCIPRLPRRLYLAGFRRMPGSRKHFGLAEIEPYLHTLRVPGTVAHLLRLLASWRADMAALGDDLTRTPLTTPALVIWGARDIVVPLSTAARLRATLSSAKQLTLHEVGHLPNEEAPAECAQAITSWLHELESQPRPESQHGG